MMYFRDTVVLCSIVFKCNDKFVYNHAYKFGFTMLTHILVNTDLTNACITVSSAASGDAESGNSRMDRIYGGDFCRKRTGGDGL